MLLKHVYFAITGVFCQQLQSGDAVDLIDELVISSQTFQSAPVSKQTKRTLTVVWFQNLRVNF